MNINSTSANDLWTARTKWINCRSNEIQRDLNLPIGSRIIYLDLSRARFQIEMPGAMDGPFYVPMTPEDIETEKYFCKAG